MARVSGHRRPGPGQAGLAPGHGAASGAGRAHDRPVLFSSAVVAGGVRHGLPSGVRGPVPGLCRAQGPGRFRALLRGPAPEAYGRTGHLAAGGVQSRPVAGHRLRPGQACPGGTALRGQTRREPPMTRISTLITNHNHARHLERAVESALAQTVPPHEVILVDDGSTDGSRDRIDVLAARHPGRLRPIFQDNAGQGAALEAAFAASSGEVILLLDSDDAWDPQKTAAVLPRLEGAGFVQHNLRQGDRPYRSFLIMSEHLRYMRTFGLFDFFVPTSGLCFRREVLQEVFPLPASPLLSICADAYITRMALFFSELATVVEPLGTYLIHDANHWHGVKHRFPARVAEIVELVNQTLADRGMERIPLERNWRLHGPRAVHTEQSLDALRAMRAETRQALPATVLEGSLHLSQGRHPEALRAFERAIAMDAAISGPESAVPEDIRLLLRVADGGEAAPHVGLSPEAAAAAWYDMAVCLVRLGRYEKALDAFAEVLRHAPHRLEIHLNRSDSLRYLGRFAEALAETDVAWAKDPTFPGIAETRDKVRRAMAGTGPKGPPGDPGNGPRGLNIQLQTTSRCNGACIICPYLDSWHKKHPGEMTDEVFDRILGELAGLTLGKVCVYFENEPLMDPRIFRRMERIRKELRFTLLEISTNASLLTPDRAEALADALQGIDHAVWVSFHGVDKRTYEGIMGLDFERGLAHVRNLARVADRRGLKMTIRGSGLPRDPGLGHEFQFTEARFRDFWAGQFDDLGLAARPALNFFPYHDRCGTIRRNDIRLRAIPRPDLTGFFCPRIEGWLHFLHTGELCICCMDYHREQVFGDIRTHSLADIRTGQAFAALRDMAYGRIPSPPDFICKRCISPNG
ncbi:glycosyltransferase [Desulfolutivibrio sulfoxidireducens]|nr:glycosyltransferase [Desulfolutivibrio sulfoxidireducens]